MLERWLEPQWRDGDRVAGLRAEFAERGALALDGILQPARIDRLRLVYDEAAGWADQYGLLGRATHAATQAEWEAAAESTRFFHYREFMAAGPGRQMAPGVLGAVQFRMLATAPAFIGWLGTLTGLAVGQAQPGRPRRMNRHHYLRSHDDSDEGRILCLVLYLSQDWHEAYGGTFEMTEGAATLLRAEPRPNRMLLFRPRPGVRHHVAPFGRAADDWERRSISVWYGPQGA